jgi:GNAT superfamily N-acetyltransferase
MFYLGLIAVIESSLMTLTFREATIEDLPEIVRMLADDVLGATRERYEDPLPREYVDAFYEIAASAANELIVAVLTEPAALIGAEDREQIVGTMTLTFIPGISQIGSKRMLIEAVRTDSGFRGRGLGTQMIEWAIERAQRSGCAVIQLTTDNKRPDSHRFYEKLGFVGSHLGMKLTLK